MSSVLVGLQVEKEALLRTIKEQEAEIANLRQAVQLNQTSLQQERETHQREMTALHNQLQEKVCTNAKEPFLVPQKKCCVKLKNHY